MHRQFIQQISFYSRKLSNKDHFYFNLAKSKYDPGPPPKSQTLIYQGSGDGQKLTNETVDATGNRATQGYSANYDGKDYSRTGSGYGPPSPDRLCQKDDRFVSHFVHVLAANGKLPFLTVL